MKGKIYVVGLGPGKLEQTTPRAISVLEGCDIITGYDAYIDLIKDRFGYKKLLSTPMRKEVERCNLAIDEAVNGNCVAMVCSGDAGIYGMAGLILELVTQRCMDNDIEVEIVPGITAACSGAAILGAPLIHDFAVISLSDLLTPWELIEKRLDAAAMADFVICLYNPSSIKRHDYLQKACDIMLRHKSADTIAGIAQNIGRDGESGKIMTLSQLRDSKVDMFTTVFIGNSQTVILNGKMITPRGYRNV